MIDNGKGTVINIASIGAFVGGGGATYTCRNMVLQVIRNNYHLIMALKVLKQTPLHLVC